MSYEKLFDEVKKELDKTAVLQAKWQANKSIETAQAYITQLEAQCRSMGQMLVVLSDPETVAQAKKGLS
ncbi:MAG: hypothetical protein HOD27_06135 [Betaproteobacteria bacterium]|jgi:hypothetical protein|nr:hypothetical protein [Pseudomonadota bacterium]MBT4386402.1 hypothetical protein [Betaproteobacteria bacterium]MDB4826085.1 hypothetical protein [Gammaproteobacteria bacterium]MBT4107208.1 hypothetical protein [Pseudomonadota bacterium]MBT4986481.1 hypothetical protein [Pseudomonadota bacterium]